MFPPSSSTLSGAHWSWRCWGGSSGPCSVPRWSCSRCARAGWTRSPGRILFRWLHFSKTSQDQFQRLTDWNPTGIGSWGDYSPWQSHLLQRIFAWGSRIYNQHFKLQQLFRLGPSDVMENQNLIWKQTSPRAFIVDDIHVPSESILSTSFWKSRKRVLPFFSSIKYLHNLICKFSCIEKRLLREERVDNYAAFSAPWPQSGLPGVIYYKSFAPKKDE